MFFKRCGASEYFFLWQIGLAVISLGAVTLHGSYGRVVMKGLVDLATTVWVSVVKGRRETDKELISSQGQAIHILSMG